MLEQAMKILDEVIPLDGASHTDVVNYSVEIPVRYAECFALLSDGRKVGLAEPRRFVGWSSHDPDKSLLFRRNGSHIELGVEGPVNGHEAVNIRNIVVEDATACHSRTEKRFIGVDGDLVLLPA
jgi:malate synthase